MLNFNAQNKVILIIFHSSYVAIVSIMFLHYIVIYGVICWYFAFLLTYIIREIVGANVLFC